MFKNYYFINFFSKNNICFLIFIFINFVFSVKYLRRVTDFYILLSIFISSFYYLIYQSKSIIKLFSNYLIIIDLILIIVFTISSYFIFKEINVESLKVDRWSVITSFWDNYFDNKYVYFAKSNMDNPPGPMPFYFILSLPFYLIKETGYLSIVGLILFYIIIKYKKTKIHIRTTLLLLIISSVFFL